VAKSESVSVLFTHDYTGQLLANAYNLAIEI